MANWTYKATLSYLFNVRRPAYLNNKLYFIDGALSPAATQNPGGIIYEIELSTFTQQAVLTPASFPNHLISWSLASFDGNLYVAVEEDFTTYTEGVVYRYDGTPENWTEVLRVGNGGVSPYGNEYNRLYALDDQIVFYTRGITTDDSTVHYSADGSSWTAGAISGYSGSSTDLIEFDAVTWWPLGIFEKVCTSGVGSCVDTTIYLWSGSAFGAFQANAADDLTQSVPSSTVHLGGSGFYSMPYNMSTAHLIDGAGQIGALMAMNAMQNIIGADLNGNNTDLYTYNAALDQWDTLETMTPSMLINPGFTGGSGWIANGASKAWLLGFNANTNDFEVWERDAAFPVPSTIAKFYYGINIPTYRSDLPFTGVNPGAMAINPAGNMAVVGGDEAGEQIVAYSSLPFMAWTDMSEGMTTGTPVTSIKYV